MKNEWIIGAIVAIALVGILLIGFSSLSEAVNNSALPEGLEAIATPRTCYSFEGVQLSVCSDGTKWYTQLITDTEAFPFTENPQ